MPLNSSKLFRQRINQLQRALLCSRLQPIFFAVVETTKVLLAIFLLVHVWQHRNDNILPSADLTASTSTTKQISNDNLATTTNKFLYSTKHHAKKGLSIDASVKQVPAGNPVDFTAANRTLNRSKPGGRIFCLCSTTTPRHAERAIYVRETWGRHCDKLVFASDSEDPYLPSKAFYNETGREFVTFKMFPAWQWVHDNFINDYDWFIKGDDDTFVIFENLRHFVKDYDPNESFYFGRPLVNEKSKFHLHYVSGSCQVFSRRALTRLVTEAYPDKEKCPGPKRKANEDAYIGYCLHNIGIDSHESRDEFLRNRFMVFSSWTHLHVGSASATNWIWRYDKTYREGDECCSHEAVSLHYMPSGKMLAMNYLIYKLRPFGVGNSIVVQANSLKQR